MWESAPTRRRAHESKACRLHGSVHRRRRQYRLLLRALAAVLVSLGTTMGVGIAGGGRLTGRLTGRAQPQLGARSGRCRDQRRAACEGTNPPGRGGMGCNTGRQARRSNACIPRGAFLPAFGAPNFVTRTAREGPPRLPADRSSRSFFAVSDRRSRKLARGWGHALERRGHESTAWTSSLKTFSRDGQRSGMRGTDGRISQRARPRHRVDGTYIRQSLYIREGIFQALPFPVRITVMGGGNFGLALSLVLARNQIPTTLLVRSDSVAEHINDHNEHPNYLKGIKLPRHIVATADPALALKDATFIIHAVPVQYTRKFLTNVVKHMPPGAPILSVSKGIETSSLMLMNDILKDVCGQERSYAFLSGPSFAREIAMNQATAVVIASDDSCLANDMAKVLSSPTFRCFTSKDVIGVEVGGAVKNVIALAAGMCEGLGLGTNAMAGLVTRGCGEMRRMAVILGGKSRTLSGLSGVGDTFGTCFGPLSRNRNFGIRLGRGESMEEILASSTEVAEGVDTALALADLIRKIDRSYRIDLKYAIIFGVADILKGKRSPKEGLEDLMTMPLRAEMYDSWPS